MKKTTILALILVLSLCIGLLSACTANDKQENSNADDAANNGTNDTADDSSAENETLVYTLGRVTSVEDATLGMDVYETNTGDEVTDCTTLDIGTLTKTEETTTVTVSENAAFYYIEAGTLLETTQDKIQVGSYLAIATDTDGVQQIVLLDYINEESSETNYTIAKVAEISEEGKLTLNTYELSATAQDYTVTDYASVDLDNFVATENTQTTSISDSVTIEVAKDGQLTASTLSDIVVGDMLIIYTNDEGSPAVVVYHADDTAA